MNLVERMSVWTQRAVYPLLIVLLFWPTVFFQVSVHETFKTSSEFLIVCLCWVVIAAVALARGLSGRPLLSGGAGSWARRAAVLLAAWVVITVPLAFNPAASWSYALTVVAYLLAAQSVLDWVELKFERRRAFVLASVAALGVWQAVIAFIQWLKLPLIEWGTAAPIFTNGNLPALAGYWWHDLLLALGASQKIGNVMGSLGNVNYFAELMALITPLGVGYALSAQKTWGKVLGWAGAAVGLFFIVTAGSRGVLAGFIVAAVLAAVALFGKGVFNPKRWWSTGKGRLAVVAAGVLVVATTAVAGGTLMAKLDKINDGDDSITGRLINWQSAAGLIPQRPLHGVGIGGFKHVNIDKLQQDYPQGIPHAASVSRFIQTHNEPLQTTVELGLIGALIAFGGLGLWFRETARNESLTPPVRMALVWGVGSVLLASFFAFPFHIPLTALAVVLLLGMGLLKPPAAEPTTLPLAWRPAYALAGLALASLVGIHAVKDSVLPLYQAHKYQYVADKLSAKGDQDSAEVVWRLADRHNRYKGSSRWNLLKTLVLNNKHEEAIALYKASEKDGLGMDSVYWYARALHITGKKDEAKAAYDKLMNYYPEGHALHKRSRRLVRQL